MNPASSEKSRLIIVSNRLPFTARLEGDRIRFDESAGGLVSGLSTFLDSYKYHFIPQEKHVWIGWPGSTIPEEYKEQVRSRGLAECNAYPVFLSDEDMEQFYLGFCNRTIWPLFHYFPSYVAYEEEFWETYRRVNALFCDAIGELIRPNDVIWVQDYHLMLLPRLLKERVPQVPVGFFLHIPFPSFEMFRLLPSRWRSDILEGLLAADLVGFHTYEYMQHFLRSVLRILGLEHQMGYIPLADHVAKVETFPMGIDFKKFYETSNAPKTQQERRQLQQILSGFRTVLSLDRLDYSKGILNRLEGFDILLDRYPEYRGKIVLIMVVVPSRIGVLHYEQMKKQIEEFVGRINGKYGSIRWTPVIYQYRNLSLYPLSALYGLSDVALITPLRDGMNLIAKEYVASRTDKTGVLVLSEMAGAAKELGEAIIVNPNDRQQIAEALREALQMPLEEQKRRNSVMQERLRRYDVVRWAAEFVNQLGQMQSIQKQFNAELVPLPIADVLNEFAKARRRILFIGYEGTLVHFDRNTERIQPGKKLLDLLGSLAKDPQNTVVLISGHDKPFLQEWFGDLPIGLVAEHGIWMRRIGEDWRVAGTCGEGWKQSLLPVFLQYADRLPGSFVEEKEYSMAWHYRAADPDQSRPIATELMDNIVHFTANIDVQVLQGNKVIEVRNAGVNKGSAALNWMSGSPYDFVLAIGDDRTDEDVFRSLTPESYSIHVGAGKTAARFNLRDPDEACEFLSQLVK